MRFRKWIKCNALVSVLLAFLGMVVESSGVSRSAAHDSATLIFRSNDGGGTWTVADSGITLAHQVRVIVVDPSSSRTIYAGTNHGVFKSTDSANGWSQASAGLPVLSIKSLMLDPRTPSTLYSLCGFAYFRSPGPVFKSVDGGITWNVIGSSIGNLVHGAYSLAIDPSNSSTLYAGGDSPDVSGVYKTTDGGGVWSFKGRFAPSSHTVDHVAVDPNTPSTVYAAVTCCNDDIDGLYKSTDSGDTWQQLWDYANILSIALDPNTPSTIYMVSATDGLQKSIDGGMHWTRLAFPGAESITIAPAAPSIVYAFGTNGLFKSTDGGVNWNRVALDASISSLAFDPNDTATIYAGTTIPGPKVTGASIIGKKLTVTGEGFDVGAKIVVRFRPDLEREEKTINDDQNPSTVLIAPKAGKQIARGQSVDLIVIEPDSVESSPFPFTRPVE